MPAPATTAASASATVTPCSNRPLADVHQMTGRANFRYMPRCHRHSYESTTSIKLAGTIVYQDESCVHINVRIRPDPHDAYEMYPAGPPTRVLAELSHRRAAATGLLSARMRRTYMAHAFADVSWRRSVSTRREANQYTDASHCYALAATASKEARNHVMWACSLIRHAFIPLYDRQFARALPLLESATRLAEQGDRQLPTSQWASAVTAQAHAGLGDLVSCQRALDHAETVDGLAESQQTSGWLRFTGSRLAEERGTCLVQLHQYQQAESCLAEALRFGTSERRAGSIASDLAVIGARLHDADRVATYAGRAISAARRTKSGYVMKELAGLRPHLGPLTDTRAVREIDERLIHLTTALRHHENQEQTR